MTSPEGDRKSLFAAHEFLLKTKLKDVHPIGDAKRPLATNQLTHAASTLPRWPAFTSFPSGCAGQGFKGVLC
jgi:hypothetical protein